MNRIKRNVLAFIGGVALIAAVACFSMDEKPNFTEDTKLLQQSSDHWAVTTIKVRRFVDAQVIACFLIKNARYAQCFYRANEPDEDGEIQVYIIPQKLDEERT
jgi:hypothetical protein